MTRPKGIKIATVNLRREDFTAYAHSLQIWEALTDDAGFLNANEIEVITVRRVS